jgi:hypothetical protein
LDTCRLRYRPIIAVYSRLRALGGSRPQSDRL